MAIRHTIAAVVFGIAALSATAAADPVVFDRAVATIPSITPIDAGRQIAVFSTYQSSTQRYKLTIADAAGVRFLPSRPRRSVFDASVGVDSHSKTVVTYTECKHETRDNSRVSNFAYWPSQSGCKVRSVDVASGRISTLKTQRAKGDVMWLPVRHGASIAYGRLRDLGVKTKAPTRKGAARDRIHTYRFELVRRDAHGKTHVERGGPGATAPVSQLNGGDIGSYGAGVTSLDFDGSRLAYSWGYQSDGCPSDQNDRSGAAAYAANAYVEGAEGRKLLSRGCDFGSMGLVSHVDIVDGAIRWTRLDRGTTPLLKRAVLGESTFAARRLSATETASPGTFGIVDGSSDATARWFSTTDTTQTRIYRSAP